MVASFVKKHVGVKIACAAALTTLLLMALTMAILVPMRLELAPENLIGTLGLFTVFLLFFQFVLIVLLVNLFINRPIEKLYHCMRKVEDGQLGVTCEYDAPDEFGVMAASFNKMIRGLSEMNETRKRIEQRLIKTEESLKYKVALEDKARIIERMNAELTDAFNNVALLYTVSQYLNSVLDLKELITSVQKIFEEKFKCDQYALYFTTPNARELHLACCKGFRQQNRFEDHRVPFGSGLAGKVAEKSRVYYFENADAAFEDELEPSELEKRMSGSIFSVPLEVRGNLIGVLTVVRFTQNGFTPTDRQSLSSIASQIAVAYDRSQLHTRTKELAVRDELTGIYNRRHFLQMLELELKRAERYKRHVSVLMIDVDYFKKFNDAFGHMRGDELLRELAMTLKKNLREVDVLARYGGEEFVVMLTDTSLADGINVASKLKELIKMNLRVEPHGKAFAGPDAPPSQVTISVGVSAYPECATTPDELLNAADMALYMAKRKGRDRVYAYQVGSLPLEELMTKMGFIH